MCLCPHKWQNHLPLTWHHNGRDGVSNHQRLECLLNRLFRRRSKKTSNLRVTGLCEGNSPVTVEFPAQRASNAENVSIWYRHHALSIWYISKLLNPKQVMDIMNKTGYACSKFRLCNNFPKAPISICNFTLWSEDVFSHSNNLTVLNFVYYSVYLHTYARGSCFIVYSNAQWSVEWSSRTSTAAHLKVWNR